MCMCTGVIMLRKVLFCVGIFYYVEIQLLYNILVSTVQQSASVTRIHTSLFKISFPFRSQRVLSRLLVLSGRFLISYLF